jgi:preprotein translocase subunit SecA
MMHWITALGSPARARLARWRGVARRIQGLAAALHSETDDELRKRSAELRWRAKSGVELKILLPEAYALVHEACRRKLELTFHTVQIVGAIGLFEESVVEMQTGEGKTLTAVMPAYLRALPGKGCHVVTVNDYLADRDAEWTGPVYGMLGLSVGCITSDLEPDQRRAEYARDITYGTAKELGFDFLRDRLRKDDADCGKESEPPVQRGNYFALIDEADSVLVDEARTPLIIAVMKPTEPATVELYRWATRTVPKLEVDVDFLYEPYQRSAWLTEAGCRKVLLLAKPANMGTIDTEQIYRQVERALVAQFGFARDRDYLVVDDEVVILDESTGRIMEGRKWQEGLHQAIEAKEYLPITAKTQSAAQITVQRFFRQYAYVAGMTGTGWQVRRELKRNFGLRTAVIPTHRPCIRKGTAPRIFATAQAKFAAVACEIETLVAAGRAILVGTPSVEASELLAENLKERNIDHQVLNARFHEIEAEIVSRAGEAGRVTIATNMAGRGTDIKLSPEVSRAGGLHVIATEMHSSLRIDRQLIGRCARQGDPGTYQFFLSLEDELLRCLPLERLEAIRRSARPDRDGELPASWLALFQRTQRQLERLHLRQRKQLLKGEQQRMEIYYRMGLDPYLEMTE